MVTRRPHAGLSRFVDRYVGYRLEGFAPGIHRGLPSRLPTFIIRLDRASAFVAGLQTGPVYIPHHGRHFGVAVDLTVRGARALLATPPGALGTGAIDLDELLPVPLRGLAERMVECRSWDARFALLDAILLRARRGAEPPAEIVHAWDILTGSQETVDVEAVAREVGWSRRHLTEVFGREAGLPPRQLLRIVRFERSRRFLRARPRTTMAAVAATAGYFDHAHMLHEWHRLAGCRPEQWLREELLSVQAEADAQALP